MDRDHVQYANFCEVLGKRAQERPREPAFAFVRPDGTEVERCTYEELWRSVRDISARLTARQLRGERALLLYEPGLEFVRAFFACLHAGVIAVPSHIARPGRTSWDRLVAIANDAGAKIILTQENSISKLRQWFSSKSDLALLEMLSTDAAPPDEGAIACEAASERLAFLQYTSGSTGDPKGTMVSHANLFANALIAGPAFDIDARARIICWLPPYHDLGLIGNILQTVYAGAFCVLLPPIAFIQNPAVWLETIQRYRGTVSMAPNFAYELCLRRIAQSKRAAYDLSSLRMTLNAAEPIRAQTLEKFAQAFFPAGSLERFRCAYGLAESTLVVSVTPPGRLPMIVDVDQDALESGRIEPPGTGARCRLVGSGTVQWPQQALIVDPESLVPSPAGSIGEIWLSGPSVAEGYWARTGEAAAMFSARTAEGAGPFLRTGDLGVLIDDELFVTGRIKEVIIVRGRKVYPQDIEDLVQRVHDAFRPAGGAAFSVEGSESEEIVIVQEIERHWLNKIDRDDLVARIKQTIFDELQLAVKEVVLVKPEVVPKTSSGKIQRALCRKLYAGGQLDRVLSGRAGARARLAEDAQTRAVAPEESATETLAPSEAAARRMVSWLRDYAPRRINSALMDSRRSMPPHIVLDFGNEGLLGMEVPKTHGGGELTLVDALKVTEQVGAIDMTLANFVMLHNSLGTRPIVRSGTSELRDEVLPLAAAGRQLIAFAMTEPHAGSDPRRIRSTARATGAGRWIVDGTKSWIGNAGWSKYLNLFAIAQDEGGAPIGMTGFCVNADGPGIRVAEEQMTMGLRAMVQNGIHASGAPVDARCLLGKIGGGMDVAQDAMMRTRLYIAAGAIGAMKRALGLMELYSSGRRVGAGILAELPETKRKMLSALSDIRALETLVYRAAELADGSGRLDHEICAIAKAAASERLWAILDDAGQVLGGRGYIEANFLPQMVRDARVLRIFEGPTETLLNFVGSSLRHGASRLPAFIADHLGDPDTARDLETHVGAWKTQYRMSANDTVDGLNLELGRVASDAVIYAAGRLAARHRFAPTGGLHDRLLLSISRTSRLCSRSPGFDGISLAGLAEAARDCLAEVATSAAAAPGEEWQTDGLLCVRGPAEPPPAIVESADDASAEVRHRLEKLVRRWMRSRSMDLPDVLSDSFASMGIDSIGAVELTHQVGDEFDIELDETILWVCSTMAALSAHIARRKPNPGDDRARNAPRKVAAELGGGGW